MSAFPSGSSRSGRRPSRRSIARATEWGARAALALALLVALITLASRLDAPLHEDEAIYGAWALALPDDPALDEVPVDKPPLALYPLALSVALLGRSEVALRLPNLIWSAVALVALARLAWPRSSARVTLAVALAAPLGWALAASAFTDPPMVALALMALLYARSGRAARAGLLFALANLAKPTALLFLPLLVAAIGRDRARLTRGGLAAAAPLLVAWAWDASRTAPSWWLAGARAYGTLGATLPALSPWPGLIFALLGPAVGLLVALLWLGRREGLSVTLTPWRLALGGTILLWIPLHALAGFQPWPRYLLPLVPLLALLAGEVAPRRATRGGSLLVALALLVAPALAFGQGIEPHDDGWRGMAEIGRAIEALPAGSTIYYSDAGRPLAWYAADAPAALLWIESADPGPAGDGEYLLSRRAAPPPIGASEGERVVVAGHFELIRLQSAGQDGP